MTPGEALTLQRYASQARRYVEYGSGASTVQAAVLAGKALSIENGGAWCREMFERTDVSFWLAQGKLDYVCVDVGATGERIMGDGQATDLPSSLLPAVPPTPTRSPAPSSLSPSIQGAWGMPTNPEDNARFPIYVNATERLGKMKGGGASVDAGSPGAAAPAAPTTASSAKPEPFPPSSTSVRPTLPRPSAFIADVVLEDGRFRVAVALKALWHINAASVVLRRPGASGYFVPQGRILGIVSCYHKVT